MTVVEIQGTVVHINQGVIECYDAGMRDILERSKISYIPPPSARADPDYHLGLYLVEVFGGKVLTHTRPAIGDYVPK